MDTVISLVILLFSVIVHEVMHGYVAYRHGDDTALRSGRLTFNPIPHIDILGTIILPLSLFLSHSSILFGWAKPVPVNGSRLNYPRRDMVFVALAGPLSNITIAWIASLIFKAFPLTFVADIIIINFVLGVFNLIPIPPLDGSRVLAYFLRGKALLYYSELERYGIIIVFLFLYLGMFDHIFKLLQPLLMVLLHS